MKYLQIYETFTNKITIGIDIDGTICDFVNAYNTLYKRYFPNNEISQDQNWDWYETMNYNGESSKTWFNNKKSEIFDVAHPYKGSVDTVNNIYDFIKTHGFTLNIITKQPTEESKESAKKWLDHYGFKYDDIIFVNSSMEKWKYCDILVDDSQKVIGSKPLSKVSIKIEHPHNTEIEGDFNIMTISNLTIDLMQKAISKLKNKTAA